MFVWCKSRAGRRVTCNFVMSFVAACVWSDAKLPRWNLQYLRSHAVKFARWQHPAVRRGARFAVPHNLLGPRRKADLRDGAVLLFVRLFVCRRRQPTNGGQWSDEPSSAIVLAAVSGRTAAVPPAPRLSQLLFPPWKTSLARDIYARDGQSWKLTKSTVSLWPRTHWRQSRPYRQHSWPSWQQCRPRQAVEFKFLPICRKKLATKSTVSATIDFVASVYTGLKGITFVYISAEHSWVTTWQTMHITASLYTSAEAPLLNRFRCVDLYEHRLICLDARHATSRWRHVIFVFLLSILVTVILRRLLQWNKYVQET